MSYNAVSLLESFYLLNKLSDKQDIENNQSWVCELLEKLLGTKTKTLKEKRILGGFVKGLSFCGSPNIQSYKFISDWLGMSETKVRDASYFYNKHRPPEDLDELIVRDGDDIYAFIEESQGRTLPNDYLKAEKAFSL